MRASALEIQAVPEAHTAPLVPVVPRARAAVPVPLIAGRIHQARIRHDGVERTVISRRTPIARGEGDLWCPPDRPPRATIVPLGVGVVELGEPFLYPASTQDCAHARHVFVGEGLYNLLVPVPTSISATAWVDLSEFGSP